VEKAQIGDSVEFPMQDILLRFRDLQARKIVCNHVTLKRWIEREGFPPGMMLGPNTRVWRESDIEQWLASRPTENTQLRGVAKRVSDDPDSGSEARRGRR
jgi:predicted DNA-binding transcriptional regulator AlpA